MPKICIVSPSLKVGGIEQALSVPGGIRFYKYSLRDSLTFYPRIVNPMTKPVIQEKPNAVMSFCDFFR